MSGSTGHTVTELLNACGGDDAEAREKLWSALYNELRAIAARQLGHENKGNTLHPTSLVHEVYLRVFGGQQVSWQNRRHFFCSVARVMRHIRMEAARRRCRLKRGGGKRPEPLDDDVPVFDEDPVELIAIDEALTRLERLHPRAAEVVKLRYFAGMTVKDVAEVLEISHRTVELDWQFARAWLHRQLSRTGEHDNKGGCCNERGTAEEGSPAL